MRIGRDADPRRPAAALMLALLAACLLAAGCREQQSLSEVEQFMARFAGLDAAAYRDTLRVLTREPAPTNLYAHYELGNLFYSQASDTARSRGWQDPRAGALMDSAGFHFERSVTIDSTFVPALVNLGSYWGDMAQNLSLGRTQRQERDERLKKSEALYLQALRHAPDDETARCNLGSLYLDLRNPTRAAAEFQRVLQTNPRSAQAHYNLAIMFAEEKIYREAIVEWKLAAKYDDGDIGQRSRDNIKIVQDLMEAKVPANLGGDQAH